MVSRKCSAQVVLEYLVMAALVMAAIIYGGPFLVNSIGARFKVMEDNAGDSVSENIKQAAPEKCICNPTSNNPSSWPEISADAECGEDGKCGEFETLHQRSCYGCSKTQETACGSSSKCCQTPVPNDCGDVDPSKTGLCATREGGTSNGRCLDANGGVQGCLFGELSYKEVCGNNVVKYTCVDDPVECEPPCVSTTWTPLPEDKCAGTLFTQTDNCGNEKENIEGEKSPQHCSSPFNVACGTAIPSGNDCPCPVGSKCAAGDCVYNNTDKKYECKQDCDYAPEGIYAAAHYFVAGDCGSAPACGNMNSSGVNWKGEVQDADACGVFNTRRYRKCGTLYKERGSICHGDSCILGMKPGVAFINKDGTHTASVTFHLGKYSFSTKRCVFQEDDSRTITLGKGDRNSVTEKCEYTSKRNGSCYYKYLFAGRNSNYNSSQSFGSWGE